MHPRATALERERECRNPLRERQLCSGDVGYVTWRSPSYVYCSISTNYVSNKVETCKVNFSFNPISTKLEWKSCQTNLIPLGLKFPYLYVYINTHLDNMGQESFSLFLKGWKPHKQKNIILTTIGCVCGGGREDSRI